MDIKEKYELKSATEMFTEVIGDKIPWVEPNIKNHHELDQLLELINDPHTNTQSWWKAVCCSLTCLGSFYACHKTRLIHEGYFGFSDDNGKPVLLSPGWHFLSSPFNKFQFQKEMTERLITIGPVTIVRIQPGWIGFAQNNTEIQVLLPGTHAVKSGTFKYNNSLSLSSDFIHFGPIKFLTVPTGFVRICYMNGKATILKEGRYAINSPLFIIDKLVSTQQQNLKFDDHHRVLLNGGVNLSVEGLLTYQITRVDVLIEKMGITDLVHSMQDVTKAELAKLFATLHLEDVSGVSSENKKDEKESKNAQSETRNMICEHILRLIQPAFEKWGVTVINFQLESTKLTNVAYGQEYEAASLEIAKAKANLKANSAKNKVIIQQAEANAQSLIIQADGEKKATIIRAQAQAESVIIEGASRNKSAESLTNKFGQELALTEQRVRFANSLKANTLVLSGNDKSIMPMMMVKD